MQGLSAQVATESTTCCIASCTQASRRLYKAESEIACLGYKPMIYKLLHSNPAADSITDSQKMTRIKTIDTQRIICDITLQTHNTSEFACNVYAESHCMGAAGRSAPETLKAVHMNSQEPRGQSRICAAVQLLTVEQASTWQTRQTHLCKRKDVDADEAVQMIQTMLHGPCLRYQDELHAGKALNNKGYDLMVHPLIQQLHESRRWALLAATILGQY